MPGTDTFVQVASDGAGKRIRNFLNNILGQDVYQQVVTRAKSDGTLMEDEATETTLAAINSKLTSGVEIANDSGNPIPISAASLPLPTGASTEATLALIKAKTDNLDVLLSTRLKPADTLTKVTTVDTITNAVTAVGNVADGVTEAGNAIKIGAKALLNKAALPTAVATGQRVSAMADEFGRLRVVTNRPQILGNYQFESGRLTVQASAHGATAGFFWIINPVGSTVLVVLKKFIVSSVPTAVTAFASAPRLTIERVTFTGTASGAQITYCKRDSNDAAPTSTMRTASTGLTLTAGAIAGDFSVPPVLTAVGVPVPVDQWLYYATDEDDYLVLRAGEGLVFRQPDAGTASDTRLICVYGAVEERVA